MFRLLGKMPPRPDPALSGHGRENGEAALEHYTGLKTVTVQLGHNAAVAVNLDKPVALDIGSHFAIREGGKTVGSGVITETVG